MLCIIWESVLFYLYFPACLNGCSFSCAPKTQIMQKTTEAKICQLHDLYWKKVWNQKTEQTSNVTRYETSCTKCVQTPTQFPETGNGKKHRLHHITQLLLNLHIPPRPHFLHEFSAGSFSLFTCISSSPAPP